MSSATPTPPTPAATRDGHQPWSWPLPAEWGLGVEARSNHLHLWQRQMRIQAQRLNLQQQTLGDPLGQPLWLFTNQSIHTSNTPPNNKHQRLVACGFHGEEPAGPWGLLQFLARVSAADLAPMNLTLLPLVNVTGFMAGTRFNAEGDNPNRGFAGRQGTPSAEGRVLLQHADLLQAASQNGVLSCHEDVLADKAYIYSLSNTAKPGAQAQQLLRTNLRHFAQHPDGLVDNCRVQNGIIFNHHDGSFEDWLFGLGAEHAACVETPALQNFATRVTAQADMIEAFLGLG